MKVINEFSSYLITNSGIVFSRKTGKTLKPVLTAAGYYKVNLYNGSGYKTKLVHRLVAEAFIENPENKPYINHIDSNRLNNNFQNLEWCTQKENINHACINTGFNCGEKHGKNKLTEHQVLEIRNSKDKISGYKMAKIYNVSTTNIYNILNNDIWKRL